MDLNHACKPAPFRSLDKPLRILIVEDDQSSRTALQRLLAWHGYFVTSAASIRDAFSAIYLQKPDVLILDLMLPDGDGALLIEHARRHHPNIRITIASGIEDAERLHRTQSLGPATILRKPITLSLLLAELNNCPELKNRPE